MPISHFSTLGGTSPASRPYSIYVEPGIYDCGFQPLSITSYVKVGGAGPGYTILKGAVDVSFVVMDEASELAHLTIINFGAGGIRSRGVSISDNVRLIGLSISASGGIKNNTAIFLRGATGVYMRNVDVVANGGGVWAVVNGLQASAQSEVAIDGSRFEGANSSSMKSNGIRIFYETTMTIRNSTTTAEVNSVSTTSDSTVIAIAIFFDGFLYGFVTRTNKCAASFNYHFSLIRSDCIDTQHR